MAFRDFDRSRAGWWALAAVLGAALAYVVHSFVGTVVFGLFIYHATRPLYDRLRRHVRPRSLAAAVALFALATPALVLTGYAALVAVREAERLTRGAAVDVAAVLGISDDLLDLARSPRALLAADPQQFLSVERTVAVLRQVGTAIDTLAVFLTSEGRPPRF